MDRDRITTLAHAGQRGAGRMGKPARRSDQFLKGRAMITLKERNNTGQLRASAWSRRACRTRLHRFRGSSVLGVQLCLDGCLITVRERVAFLACILRLGGVIDHDRFTDR